MWRTYRLKWCLQGLRLSISIHDFVYHVYCLPLPQWELFSCGLLWTVCRWAYSIGRISPTYCATQLHVYDVMCMQQWSAIRPVTKVFRTHFGKGFLPSNSANNSPSASMYLLQILLCNLTWPERLELDCILPYSWLVLLFWGTQLPMPPWWSLLSLLYDQAPWPKCV